MEVTEMSMGYGWQPLADALVDLLLYAFWFLAGGAVALGACWYGGYEGFRAWQEWERESRRRRQERRIEKEAARGLAQLEEFLGGRTHAPLEESTLPKAARQGKGNRRRARHRDP